MLHRGSNGTSRLPSLLTLGVGLTAALLTTIAFLIDVILVAIARNHVKDLNQDVSLNWGNAVRPSVFRPYKLLTEVIFSV